MIEVLKQALEALDNITDAIYINSVQEANAFEKSIEAMTSLRQAIAGLESQEPLALETVYETIIQWDEGGGKRSRRDLARRIIDLYTHPPQRTEQEPVAWMSPNKERLEFSRKDTVYGSHTIPLYTHPPQLERNFCSRCGKRTNDIHTCTPPQDNT